MSNFNARDKFNVAINRAYTLNYTALRFANQDKPIEGTYTANDIFNKSPKDERLSTKRNALAEVRNDNFYLLSNALNESSKNLKIIKDDLEGVKALLVDQYNQLFNTNKNFDDIFDGFFCIDENLKAIIEGQNTKALDNISPADLQVFFSNYVYYIDAYEKYTLAPIYIDLISQLSDAVTDYGVKTAFYDKPRNPMISKLTKDKITELIQCSATLMVDFDNEYKQLEKELNKAYKQGTKKGTDVYDSANLINQLTMEISQTASNQTFAEELFDIATAFEKRLESANSDCITTLEFKLKEKLGDSLVGIKDSGKLNIDEIYVHKYELDFIKFLFDMLDTSPEKIKTEHLNTSSPVEKSQE